MKFQNRVDAGRQLAAKLLQLPLTQLPSADLVAVGMPRGGIPVATEVALALSIPMDVVLVRKLGVPSQPEFAMGAIGEDDVRFIDERTITDLRITAAQLEEVERAERRELQRRAEMYRGTVARVSLVDKYVLVIDDGIATGASARVACRAVRAHGARSVILAVPVAPPQWENLLGAEADHLVAVAVQPFRAVGDLYRDFRPTSDDEVVRCLARARADQQ